MIVIPLKVGESVAVPDHATHVQVMEVRQADGAIILGITVSLPERAEIDKRP